jgi:hypothetical protein
VSVGWSKSVAMSPVIFSPPASAIAARRRASETAPSRDGSNSLRRSAANCSRPSAFINSRQTSAPLFGTELK